MKKGLIILAKIAIASAAMYLALRNVNWQEIKQLGWSSSLWWLVPAMILYNISQCISSYRLLQFYKILQPGISYLFNLRLYYQGMFYNLFLPGGIGGDAYKIIALKKNGSTYKQLTTATLLDRINGLSVVVLIILLLSKLVSMHGLYDELFSILPFLVAIGLPCFWLLVHFYFKPFNKVLPLAALISVLVQCFQLTSFYFILIALQIDTGSFTEPALVFFVSAVISALPFSIGGIGTRELAMATGAAYFHFSATKMVSASLLFFLMVVISSLAGWAISSVGSKRDAE